MKWKNKLDVSSVWYDGEDTDEATPEIVESMHAIAVLVDIFRQKNYGKLDFELNMIAEELDDAAENNNIGWFNVVWDALYDWADAEGVWVQTR